MSVVLLEPQLRKHVSKEKREDSVERKSSYSITQNSCHALTCSSVRYLQEKQREILAELHNEIEGLKRENSELKLKLCLALNNPECLAVFNRTHEADSKVNIAELQSLEQQLEEERNRVDNLELELKSATKMLQEAKWVKLHYESRVLSQEVKLQELEKQLVALKDAEVEVILPLKMTGKSTGASVHTFVALEDFSPQRHRSAMSKYELGQRSSQCLLPADYKEKVATLPPILTAPPPSAKRSNGNASMIITRRNRTIVGHLGNATPTVTSHVPSLKSRNASKPPVVVVPPLHIPSKKQSS